MSGPFTLADVCINIVDCEHKTAPIDPSGEFFAVGTPAMRTGSIDYTESRRISAATFEIWTRRMRPAFGDLLLAREAPVGPIVQIPRDGNVAAGQRTVLLRPDCKVADSAYLYYLLRSPAQQALLQRKAAGSTVAHLNVADVRGFELPPLPSLSKQKAVSEILQSIDSKIESNTKIVKMAETLSELIFRSLLTSADEVPLSSLATFINGKAFTKNASGSARVVIRIAELNSGIGASTVYSDAHVPQKYSAQSGDILFAWSGSLTLHRWYRADAIINQHIFKVVPNSDSPHWLVFQLIKNKLQQFKNIASDKATTMGHIQRKHLDEPVLLPSQEDIKRWDPTMSALWGRMLSAEKESEQLSVLRDALLPPLMSTRLRVPDAEVE